MKSFFTFVQEALGVTPLSQAKSVAKKSSYVPPRKSQTPTPSDSSVDKNSPLAMAKKKAKDASNYIKSGTSSPRKISKPTIPSVLKK